MVAMDLNKLAIQNADGPDMPLRDTGTSSADGSASVYFRDIECSLIRHIEAADVVVGCVAWLSSRSVLHALARKKAVAIVVQKEDFLRPDLDQSWKQTGRELRTLYRALPCGFERFQYPGLVSTLSVCGDTSMDAVRCLGSHNNEQKSAVPRAHHKFAVFCRHHDGEVGEPQIVPYEVWTGSYNWTRNAVRSLENAVVLRDPAIVNAFFGEWEQAYAVSEPLDWDSLWAMPLRIGT